MKRIYGLVGRNKNTGSWETISKFDDNLSNKLDLYYKLKQNGGILVDTAKIGKKEVMEEKHFDEIWIADSRRPYKQTKII